MPAVSRYQDQVVSADGTGDNCASPMITSVDQVNSKRVYVNGLLVVVQGNVIAPHNRSGCVNDGSVLTTYSTKVRINGLGIGRIGDRYTSEAENIIVQGSHNVFSG